MVKDDEKKEYDSDLETIGALWETKGGKVGTFYAGRIEFHRDSKRKNITLEPEDGIVLFPVEAKSGKKLPAFRLCVRVPKKK